MTLKRKKSKLGLHLLVLIISVLLSNNLLAQCLTKKFKLDSNCQCRSQKKCLSLYNKNYKNYVLKKDPKYKKITKLYHKNHKETLKQADSLFSGQFKYNQKKIDLIISQTKKLSSYNKKIEKKLQKKHMKMYGKKLIIKNLGQKIKKRYEKKYPKLFNQNIKYSSMIQKMGGSKNKTIPQVSNSKSIQEQLNEINRISVNKENIANEIEVKDEFNRKTVDLTDAMKKKFKVNDIHGKGNELFKIISNRYQKVRGRLDQRSITKSNIAENNKRIKKSFNSLSKSILFD